MRPILYDFGIDIPLLGPLNFPAYFTLLALSFWIGMSMTSREAPRLGLDRDKVWDLCLGLIIASIIGARILHVLADGHFMDYLHLCSEPTLVKATEAKVASCTSSKECGFEYVCNLATRTCHPPRDCLAALKVWRGGMAFYGGFIFAAAFGLRFARKHGMDMWKTADLTAPWIAFGLALTRMGCFLNGCCFGKQSDAAWAVTFPYGSIVHRHQIDAGLVTRLQDALPVHPAQLYLATLNLLTFFLLYFVVRERKAFDGQVFAWLLVCKGVFRSLVEIWRDDERGVFFGGLLSTSQILSVPLVALGVLLLLRRGRLWLPRSSAAPAP